VATLGEVREVLRSALDKIAQAIGVAHGAAELAEEARGLVGVAGHGTLQSDVEEVQELFTKVVEGIGEPEGFTSGLATVADSIRSFERRLETGDSGTSATTTANSVPSEPGAPEHISLLRGQLPPPVRERGQKTHGRWFAPGVGDQEIVSGEGAAADTAAEFLESLNMPRRGVPFIASHVETKLAVHMRNTGIRHATVLINNLPCPGLFGCEALIGMILPAGSTLTIYGSDGYEQTIAGGKKAPW
jgi:hypothetical protein